MAGHQPRAGRLAHELQSGNRELDSLNDACRIATMNSAA